MKAVRELIDQTIVKHAPQWKVLADEAKPDVLDRITVRIFNQRVRRAPDAPMGSYEHTVNIRLVSHVTDVTIAETDLEAALDSLLEVIERHLAPLGALWDEAEKVIDSDTQTLAWDIPVRLITSRTE